MSIWMISDGCTIDESSIEHNIIKEGKAIHLRRQCWTLLIELLRAKKHNRVLSFENIGDVLWHNDGGWDEARKKSLKKILDEIRSAIGSDCIGNTYGTGYYLTYSIREVLVPHIDKREYYEKLWRNHCKGTLRDHVATGNVRELIDFFVLPSIALPSGTVVEAPFSDVIFSKLLMAGSGLGKSTLLDVLLLCSVVDALIDSESSALSSNSKDKINEYNHLRECLFGVSSKRMFPVFIHSDKANSSSYASVLELAEAQETDCFITMVDEAHHSGALLFLIDSIDEVEADKLGYYLESIKKMLSDYPKASVVFASRFLGKKSLPLSSSLTDTSAFSIICRLCSVSFVYSWESVSHAESIRLLSESLSSSICSCF